MKLTERGIAAMVCPEGKRDTLHFDDVQRGLAVRVTQSGAKSFLAQFRAAGVVRRVPLGSTSAISLAAAREATRALMGDVARGGDPAEERRRKAAAAKADRERQTLAELIESWSRLHLSRRRASYAREATRALHRVFPEVLGKPADALDRATVVRLLDKLAGEGSGTMADRIRAYGSACFRWSMKRGSMTANPFAQLPTFGPATKRDRVLSDAELASVWKAAAAGQPPFSTIVLLLILTGQRVQEVAGMAWPELSDDLTLWTIAGPRAKNGKASLVPLSAPARELLRSLRRGDGLVLPGETGAPFAGWTKARKRLCEVSGTADWTLHDIRRTLATGLQRLGVRLEVTEGILNHIGGSRAGIVGIYQRHNWAKEKRAALEAWGKHVLSIVQGGEPASNVVSLSK